MSETGRASEGRRGHAGLRRRDLDADPVRQFGHWYADAERGAGMPERMTLATVDADGRPDARTVLLKGFDAGGLRFFSNLESSKAEQLAARPHAALVFHWPELDRQVRLRGEVEPLPEAESDEYFAGRDRLSQLGAWASQQSRPLAGREELEESLERTAERFGGLEAGDPVPRPAHWGGYRLLPAEVELWQGRPGRLHDRFLYARVAAADPEPEWTLTRLAP